MWHEARVKMLKTPHRMFGPIVSLEMFKGANNTTFGTLLEVEMFKTVKTVEF